MEGSLCLQLRPAWLTCRRTWGASGTSDRACASQSCGAAVLRLTHVPEGSSSHGLRACPEEKPMGVGLGLYLPPSEPTCFSTTSGS